jgi:hypothetical protein
MMTTTTTVIGGQCWEYDVTGLKNYDKQNYFALIPNPATTEVNIELNLFETLDATVSLMNAQGQVLFTKTLQQVDKERITFPTNDLSSGIYLVNLVTEKGLITKKLVINN